MTSPDVAEALVTGAFSRRMLIKLPDGSSAEARIKGKRLRPVCGDRVTASRIPDETDWLITGIRSRTNELTRPDSRGRREVLAANLDCVVVMAAAEPPPDWFIVDRYLAAAENMGATAVVAFNKTDLVGAEPDLPDALDEYADAGYKVIACSAESGENLEELGDSLAGRTAIVVGQSGVGKSSVINQLMGSQSLRTGALSKKYGEGRHTTVNSIMLELPNGGFVVDSPGVRDYAPALDTEDQVIRGFREINERSGDCRFANCRHLREPDCAVKLAVDRGEISARRYESYKRLVAMTKELADRKFQG
jgi:ribosome biogenesis GTPase